MNAQTEWLKQAYIKAAAGAMSGSYDLLLHEMQYGWDETLPRTFWQRLFRRPATVVHHKGAMEW